MYHHSIKGSSISLKWRRHPSRALCPIPKEEVNAPLDINHVSDLFSDNRSTVRGEISCYDTSPEFLIYEPPSWREARRSRSWSRSCCSPEYAIRCSQSTRTCSAWPTVTRSDPRTLNNLSSRRFRCSSANPGAGWSWRSQHYFDATTKAPQALRMMT